MPSRLQQYNPEAFLCGRIGSEYAGSRSPVDDQVRLFFDVLSRQLLSKASQSRRRDEEYA